MEQHQGDANITAVDGLFTIPTVLIKQWMVRVDGSKPHFSLRVMAPDHDLRWKTPCEELAAGYQLAMQWISVKLHEISPFHESIPRLLVARTIARYWHRVKHRRHHQPRKIKDLSMPLAVQ